ncbi:MAG: Holliday junction branch migration protein RuvA [Syntrophales bacterium]|jgi:Holliday junction DNA helicase RuvA|nr:Holliday junction branch migration protein RuvA [Syntrophales bacterium]MDD4340133.1 Holliday junction branch migration protein RuvA [Syntrophales bacterium]HOG08485.1 Holliday junction branch migration protein RuvA [Syntrophales bacterium]HPB70518.1 Holliday junction branch migration protein RuvA [Syntrophales bacterium]HQN26219.1 Holliday junction branch migration protein RuvA [Syntrophales bacterium]
MIARLSGTLIHKNVNFIVIDAQGVGYRVFVPLTTFYELPEPGERIALHIHTQVREDAISLYGFHAEREREIFQIMLGVSGIGPRLALNILSGISAAEFVAAILQGNLGRLVGIPGVGKKMGERLIVELRDKIARLEAVAVVAGERRVISLEFLKEDALSALTNLGYKPAAARGAVDAVIAAAAEPPSLDVLLKEALKRLAG